jgi:hypothetical protein
MADNPIDWFDIALHALPGAFWAGMCGWMAALGAVSSLPSGVLLLVIAGIAWAGGLMFWPLRELEQHEGKFGGIQSQLEWLIPFVVQLATGPTVFLIMS